jgi:hypothetical protein
VNNYAAAIGTGASYLVQEGDEGFTLEVIATATNENGATAAATSAATAAVLDAAPTVTIPVVSGTAQEGQTLTASASAGQSDNAVTYAWYNSADNFTSPVGTGPTYRIPEEGVRIEVVATATNDNGVSISAASTPTAIVADPAVVATGGFALKVTQGVDPGPQVVATFTDPGGPEPNTADHYGATINWGDGSAASAGTISFDAATSRFTVTGDHTYATIGTFTVITTINHEGVVSSATSSAASSSTLEPGKVTGGGEIGKGRNFAIEAQSDDDDGPKGRPEGEVEYQDKAHGIDLHSTSITLVGVQADKCMR